MFRILVPKRTMGLAAWLLLLHTAFAADITVINTHDSGEGSLRWALEKANSNSEADQILFNIPKTDQNFDPILSVWVIRPLRALPPFTEDNTLILGQSQQLNQGNSNPKGPEIMVDGSAISGNAHGFEIKSAGNKISDLIVGNFSQNQIVLIGEKAYHNVIHGCYIGLTPDGSAALKQGHGWSGIVLNTGAKKNQVGGSALTERNYIGGLGLHGILAVGINCRENIISGNYVGTDITGSKAIPNEKDGIRLEKGPRKNLIGGNSLNKHNLCSGNKRTGIRLESAGTDSNTIVGNWIGLAATGSDTLGNGEGGIVLANGVNYTIIGGETEEMANAISGNRGSGIQIRGITRYNHVLKNIIGLDARGQKTLGNSENGVYLLGGASENRIVGNIIGGNGPGRTTNVSGILLEGIDTNRNSVSENHLGIHPDGRPMGNLGHGICLQNGPSENLIGPSNHIAYNSGDGVRLVKENTVANRLTQNSIFTNSGKGIEVLQGANKEIPPPVIQTLLGNTLEGLASPNMTIEVFTGPDGQGKTFLTSVNTDASGKFVASLASVGDFLTSTCTDPTGNTSAFSLQKKTAVAALQQDSGPKSFSLAQNYPNPFNPVTTIDFYLPHSAHVTLDVFNLAGQRLIRLIDAKLEAGSHQVAWNLAEFNQNTLPSGTYWYRLQAGEYSAIKAMLLLK